MRITSGSLLSDIAIIGESPRHVEMVRRQPFVGSSGYLLNTWLELNGLFRNQCFITNVIGDRISKSPKQSDLSALFSELSRIRPKVILAVGELAFSSLTGLKGITKYRGSAIQQSKLDFPTTIIPCIHPAKVMRNYDYNPLCIADVGKVKRWTNKPYYKIDQVPTIPNASAYDLSLLLSSPALAIDVETIPDPETGIGFCHLTRIGFSNGEINLSIALQNIHTKELKIIRDLLLSPKIIKIAHNMTFDWTVIMHNFNLVPAYPYYDTITGWHAIEPELPKSLDCLASILLDDYHYWKDLSSTNLGIYNALDCYYTYQVWDKLKAMTRPDSDSYQIYQLMMNLVEPVIYMQTKGVKVDLNRLNYHKKILIEKYNEAIKNLPCNPNSPKQVKEFLYQILGLPKQYKRGTKDLSTNEKAIKNLYSKSKDNQIKDYLRKILQARHYRKIKSTYINASLWKGRLKSSFNIVAKENL